MLVGWLFMIVLFISSCNAPKTVEKTTPPPQSGIRLLKEYDLNTPMGDKPGITYFRNSGDFTVDLSPDGTMTISSPDKTTSTTTKLNSLDNMIDDSQYIWFPYDLKEGILRFSKKDSRFEVVKVGYDFRDFQAAGQDSLIWMLNKEGLLVFSRNTLDAYRITGEEFRGYNTLKIEGNLVIIEGNDNKKTFDSKALLSRGTNVKVLLLEETPFFSSVSDLISNFKGDYRSSWQEYINIRQKFGENTNDRVVRKLIELKESLALLLPNNYNEAMLMSGFVNDTVDDLAVKAGYYKHLFTIAIHEGRLADALNADAMLVSQYTRTLDEEHAKIAAKVEEADAFLNSLEKKQVSEDEALWLKGKTYYDLFTIAGPKGRYGINMNMPFSYLRRLKNQFPQSRFSDDAELLMLKHMEQEIINSGDQKMLDKVITEYSALIGKYPASELIPEMLYRQANLYFTKNSTFDERAGNLTIARNALQRITKGYPSYQGIAEAGKLLSQVNYAIEKLQWEVRITLPKRTVKPGEPLVVTYQLVNNDSTAKTISIFKESKIPNFILTVVRYELYNDSRRGSVTFIPDYTKYEEGKKDLVIEPGKNYTEARDMLQNARGSANLPLGKFVLGEGRYKITAIPFDASWSGAVKSNTLWLTIKKEEK